MESQLSEAEVNDSYEAFTELINFVERDVM
jgi:hypothetical protein